MNQVSKTRVSPPPHFADSIDSLYWLLSCASLNDTLAAAVDQAAPIADSAVDPIERDTLPPSQRPTLRPEEMPIENTIPIQ